ncbi:MAG: hypothetical protein GOMPHAMPRED_001300 [Gomphillus americanus]|uniref:Enoyl reductase (ER) domain-containing protein n=1 Tax=Gomphillus americanus TaxID=1940652 RepID=A0A8H3I794_9LECA|nr:MAG: hypothetical protein GOMPHAMPRED_001300 [Gomphillus americanus]
MSVINRAAFLQGPKDKCLVTTTAPYPEIKNDHDIIIKTKSIALNPVDHILQHNGTNLSFPWLKYSVVLGHDAAGEVVEVGLGVTRFKKGDRVVGLGYGLDKSEKESAQSGRYPRSTFQEYILLSEHMTAPIPDQITYEAASVIPLGFVTAACGLFQAEHLKLDLPNQANLSRSTGETVLICGGSTSVGMNAIQLATAAGYEVLTTCSPRNFDLVKSLGASQAWDYKSPTVVKDITKAFNGKKCAGALTLGNGSAEMAFDILQHCEGNRRIALGTFPLPDPLPERFVLPRMMFYISTWMLAAFYQRLTRGIQYNIIWSGTLIQDGIGKELFTNFLPNALRQGRFRPAPETRVVGTKLEDIQAGLDGLAGGVSACKLVVQL